MKSELRSLAQSRALHAWHAVNRAKEKLGDLAEEYARESKRLPVRILTSGLGPSIAFARAKGGRPRTQLVDDLADWLLNERRLAGSLQKVDGRLLAVVIMEGGSDFLRIATEETLLYSQWLTRYAEAEIKSDGKSERQG